MAVISDAETYVITENIERKERREKKKTENQYKIFSHISESTKKQFLCVPSAKNNQLSGG